MPRRGERIALALAAVAAVAAGVALALEALGPTSAVAAVGFAAIGLAAGAASVAAWARGPRGDPRRLPLLLAAAVLPADAAFVLASASRDGAASAALGAIGVAAVAAAVAVLLRGRR